MNSRLIGYQVCLQPTDKFIPKMEKGSFRLSEKKAKKVTNFLRLGVIIWSPALYLSILQMTINLKPNCLLSMWITLPFVKQLPVLKKRKIQIE